MSLPGFSTRPLAVLSDAEATTTFEALTALFMSFGLETPEAACLIEARRLLELQLRMAGRDALVEQLHAEATRWRRNERTD